MNCCELVYVYKIQNFHVFNRKFYFFEIFLIELYLKWIMEFLFPQISY